jgi:5-formyltetrahydrofolate cyclo-ligase
VPDLTDEADASVRSAKADLRASILAARRARPADDASAIRSKLLDLVRRQRPAVIATYVPVGTEPGGPDLPEFLARSFPCTARILLPVLLADLDLDWSPYTGPASLVTAGRGLREPTGPRLGPSAVARAQLVIVPAVAVDSSGRRLGRGGGSYDRALARTAPSAVTVALLHDGELVDAVPAEPHDRRVRAAITPSGGLRWLG